MAEPRPINDQERHWLRVALKRLPGSEPYLAQVDTLQVVQECGCGQPSCRTVSFEGSERGKHRTITHTDIEGVGLVVVDVHEGTDRIVGLEVI
jgi:hypothetical protein